MSYGTKLKVSQVNRGVPQFILNPYKSSSKNPQIHITINPNKSIKIRINHQQSSSKSPKIFSDFPSKSPKIIKIHIYIYIYISSIKIHKQSIKIPKNPTDFHRFFSNLAPCEASPPWRPETSSAGRSRYRWPGEDRVDRVETRVEKDRKTLGKTYGKHMAMDQYLWKYHF